MLNLLLRGLSECGALLNTMPVANAKRSCKGGAAYDALSRLACINGQACGSQQCCRADWARHLLLWLPVRAYVLMFVVRIASGRVHVVECGSANCA